MKKLIIIFCLLFPAATFGQKYTVIYHEVDISGLSGSDTTISQFMPATGPLEIYIDSCTYTGSGGTFDLYSRPADSVIWVAFTDTSLPYTLTATQHRFILDVWHGRYLGVKISKGSFTAGIVRIYIVLKY